MIVYEELAHIRMEREMMINIHSEAIKYHQAKIDEINRFTVEEEFYRGNFSFPDYPGNEWMKEETIYTCRHCPEIMLTHSPLEFIQNETLEPTPNELEKLVCHECKERMWVR